MQLKKWVRLASMWLKTTKQLCSGIVFFANTNFPSSQLSCWDGENYKPLFLEIFPPVEIELCKWTTENIEQLSCEYIGNELYQKIIPKIYKSYLEECVENQQLSMNDF